MAEERVTSLLMLVAVQPAAVHCVMHQSLMVQLAKALEVYAAQRGCRKWPCKKQRNASTIKHIIAMHSKVEHCTALENVLQLHSGIRVSIRKHIF